MNQHEDPRRPDSGEEDGQVSELDDAKSAEAGGADSTDKSTGTAPDAASEPPD